ncbi:hypothetical protein [Nostocoides australiense]|nr:hypothetical protein [Actinomycetota bacterium]
MRNVAAVNSTLAWAVGSEGETGAPREVLNRWNGTAWRRTDLPGVIRLTGVSAANRAWIVGQAGPRDPWGESPYAGRLTASGWAPATNGIAPGAVATAVATRGATTILVGYRPAVYPARAPELDDLAAVRGSNRVWGVGSQPRLHGSLLKNFGLVAVNR